MGKYLVIVMMLFVGIEGVGQQVIRLYNGKAPGSESWNWKEAVHDGGWGKVTYNVAEPELLVYPAPREKANGTAIIVAPGGAFHILSMDNEGIDVAKWLNTLGVTAFVIKYRVVHSVTNDPIKELSPLMSDFKKLDEINEPVVEMATNDGIEAMKYVRNHAGEYGINTSKIGFMGFSAGGTLTMSVMMSASSELKPNFAAHIYLYGKAVLGNLMPTTETPLFVAVASDDQLGFVPHSIELYQKWQEARQPAELHIYEKGGHGFGMRRANVSSDQWSKDFENWLRVRKLI